MPLVRYGIHLDTALYSISLVSLSPEILLTSLPFKPKHSDHCFAEEYLTLWRYSFGWTQQKYPFTGFLSQGECEYRSLPLDQG